MIINGGIALTFDYEERYTLQRNKDSINVFDEDRSFVISLPVSLSDGECYQILRDIEAAYVRGMEDGAYNKMSEIRIVLGVDK